MYEDKWKVIGSNEGYSVILHACDTKEQAEELLAHEKKTGKHRYFVVGPTKR
jgi:hypothetical protein